MNLSTYLLINAILYLKELMNQPASGSRRLRFSRDSARPRIGELDHTVNICQLMYSQPQDIDILLPAASAILEHHLAYGREAGIVLTYLVGKLSVLPYQTGCLAPRIRGKEVQQPFNA